MHGRMREHGAPAVDQGVGEGVAQEGWGLAGFGVGEQPQESCGFITPTSSNFNPKDNKATSPIPEEFTVGVQHMPSKNNTNMNTWFPVSSATIPSGSFASVLSFLPLLLSV